MAATKSTEDSRRGVVALGAAFAATRRSNWVLVIAAVGFGFWIATISPREGSASSPQVLETTVIIDPHEVEIVPDGSYQQIRLRGAGLDRMQSHLGHPQLPVIARFFLLPPDCEVAELRITPLSRETLPGRYRPFPILDDSTDVPPETPPWEQVIYPLQTGFVENSGQARQYRMAKIPIWPLQYDASTEQLSVLTSISIQLRLRPLSAEEDANALRILRPECADDPFLRQRAWIAETVVNPEDLAQYYPRYEMPADSTVRPPQGKQNPYGTFGTECPSTEGMAFRYVIITSNYDQFGNYIGNMERVFKTYAKHRTNMGLPTTVRTIDWIENNNMFPYVGPDRPARIRAFIRDAVEKWGASYVLLGGDEAVVPTRRLGGPDQADWPRLDPPADFWYSRIAADESWNADQDAWIGETEEDINTSLFVIHGFSSVWVSRLPARNADEAQVMIDKTMRYMTAPPAGDFYRTATVASGIVNSSIPNNDNCGVYLCENRIIRPLKEESPIDWIIQREYPLLAYSKPCSSWSNICYKQLYDFIEAALPDTNHWWHDDLRDRLNAGTHLLYHVEHSMRDRLGSPSAYQPPPECPDQADWDESCRVGVKSLLETRINPLGTNEVLELQNGLTYPYFSIVMSSGSTTNMMDMDAIGEAFLRAPSGGAVIYVGKTSSYGGGQSPTFCEVFQLALEYAFGDEDTGIPFLHSWYEALDTSQIGAFEVIKAACILPFLGDPTLCPIKISGGTLTTVVTPNPLTKLGIQTVTVTVRDQDGATVEGVDVCLRQGESLYARTKTNGFGVASFKGVLIQDAADTVKVSAYKGSYALAEATVDVTSASPFLGYKSHQIDDCGTGQDCDGVLQAGESCAIRTTLRNTGTAASQMGMAVLRPTPAVVFTLKINDEFRRADTIIGKESAPPPAGADSFRVPLLIEGTRTEGEPLSPGSLTRESFRVWRNEGTGIYTVGCVSPSRSADTVFTGIIKCEADFSNVAKIGELNDAYFWSGDSIWFQFHGDLTEDRLTFRAEAPNWLNLITSTMSLPALQPGDSTTVAFQADLASAIPNRAHMVFTVTAYQGLMATSYFHSDFIEPVTKPSVDLVSIDEDFGDWGCADTSWTWTPLVKNYGNADADSVVLTLRKVSGAMSVLDSVVVINGLLPDSAGQNGSFVMCGNSAADTAGFMAYVHQETYRHEYYESIDHDSSCVGNRNGPGDLRADLLKGTVLLRWAPIGGSGYRIEYARSLDGPRTLLDRIDHTMSRYEVRMDLSSPGPDGYGDPYYFFVSNCYGSLCGNRSVVGPIYPWVRERAGDWPKLLAETPACAPQVFDLWPYFPTFVSRAIFVATNKIYAWEPSGGPIGPDVNGLIYDPGFTEVTYNQRFKGALAIGNWNTADSEPEIAGNLDHSGVYLIKLKTYGYPPRCCDTERVNLKNVFAPWSPIVASFIQPANRTVLFLGGTVGPPFCQVFAWDGNPNGSGIGVDDCFISQYPYPDSSAYNYENLAIGYDTTPGSSHHDLIAVTRQGTVTCYNLTNVNLNTYAMVKWSHYLSPLHWLSTPGVGDVDGDGNHDVVVTTRLQSPDHVFVIDENSGSILVDATFDSLYFTADNDDYPPRGPAVVDLDGDGDDEIVVAGDLNETNPNTAGVRMHVFDYEDGSLSHYMSSERLPYTERNESDAIVMGAPIGTPVIADYDYDDVSLKPDIIVTTASAGICAFEYDPDGAPRLYPKPGWPMILQDVAYPPVLTEFYPEGNPTGYEDPGQFSLVTLCRDGWLHVYDLPRTSVNAPDPLWDSYGFDGGNRRANLRGNHFDGPRKPELGQMGMRVSRWNPGGGATETTIYSATRIRVNLSVYDVAGRIVKELRDGVVEAGETRVMWDGRAKNGGRAPSGIYWYRLSWPGGAEARKVLVLR